MVWKHVKAHGVEGAGMEGASVEGLHWSGRP